MSKENALQVFTLGVKYGAHQSKLGLDIDQMTDDRLADILLDGFKEHLKEIEHYAAQIAKKLNRISWYAEHWTAEQAYRFGLLAGFDQALKTEPDKKGQKLLDEDTIDKLTQLQFRSCKEFDDEN